MLRATETNLVSGTQRVSGKLSISCCQFSGKTTSALKTESDGSGGLGSTSSLSLLPGLLRLWMVVPVWVPFIGQIDLFKNWKFNKSLIKSPSSQKIKVWHKTESDGELTVLEIKGIPLHCLPSPL